MNDALYAKLPSPLGTIILREEQGRLSGLVISAPDDSMPEIAPCTSPVLSQATIQLAEYFAGLRREFTLPLILPDWRPFSLQVLGVLRAVPYGATTTYGEMAAQAGAPRAARAVGQVMAANPLPIIIPCHRVVGAGGRSGGYSGGGGLSTKQWLLDFERTHCHDSESATL